MEKSNVGCNCHVACKNCKGLNCAKSPELDNNDDDMV